MCGIAGIVNFRNNQFVDRESIRRMCEALRHRGPDSDGYFISANVALGMKRLKIIDLDTGDQPVFNEDKTCCIVFNGEIYNFQELRTDLEKKGHVFKTKSDTETILHLYEDYGTGCVERLNGMFAFAIWDSKEKKLIIGRDRLGEKPLYYSMNGGKLLFASEIKSIVTLVKDLSTDYEAIHHYLTLKYIPDPFTIYREIRKLEPGYCIVFSQTGFTNQKYWDVEFISTNNKTKGEWVIEAKDKIASAVRSRLISDVPVGVFLSGGIDSSTVAFYAAAASSETIKTFSVIFAGSGKNNETEYIHTMAEYLHAEHHDLTVKPDIVDLLQTITRHFDEPFAVTSSIPIYLLSAFAKDYVKVILSGDGGDEVFGGYPWYQWERFLEDYRGYFKPLSRVMTAVGLNGKNGDRRGMLKNALYKMKRFNYVSQRSLEERRIVWNYAFDDEEKECLYSNDTRIRTSGFSTSDFLGRYKKDRYSNVNNVNYIDLKTYLPGEMLTKVDRMTMAHGIESRTPFTNHELVEFAASIPSQIRFNNGVSKYILKQAMKGLLPETILNRKKHGFNMPLDEWLRTELKDFTLDLLSKKQVNERGLFDYNYVKSVLDTHFAGKANYSNHIFCLLVLELWFQMNNHHLC